MKTTHGIGSTWNALSCLGLAAWISFCSGQAAAQQPTTQPAVRLPAAEEIIEKAIEAQGGKAALQKLQSRICKGTFAIAAQNIKGALTTYEQAPNKKYVVIEIEGLGKVESGSDGEVCWENSSMTGARVLEGEERALALRDATFHAALEWKKLYEKAECTGEATVDDEPCWKVAMTPKGGSPETIFYSKKTGLPTKIAWTLTGPMGELLIETKPREYKKVDDVLMAHVMSQTAMGIEQTITLDRIEHNMNIPADRFALPDAIKALLDKSKPDSKPTTGATPKGT